MAVRSEASRQAVLSATMELLGTEAPGPVSIQKLTIEAIARHAGVGKATIYRWWPTKAALVIDSFVVRHVSHTPVDDTLPAGEALRRHVARLVEWYSGHEGSLVAQLIAECQYDPATLQAFHEHFWAGRVAVATELMERAQDEGVVRKDVAPAFAAELIYSPIYQRLLFGNAPLDAEFAERVVAIALRGLASHPDRA